MITISCPLCNSDQRTLLSTQGQFNIPAHISICKQCGFVYLNPRWSKQEYDEFHDETYDSLFGSKTQSKNNSKAKQIVDRLPDCSVKTVLELGAGDGRNLKYIQSVSGDVRLHAIEISENCRITLDKYGVIVIAKDVDEDWESKYFSTFDLVILRHTLEHLLDPITILKKVSKVLKKNGMVYIAVPDMLHPKSPLTKYWFRVVHVNYFSGHTLKFAAQKASLTPITLVSEHHELWGVFRKGRYEPHISNHYNDQIKIIQKKMKIERQISYKIRHVYISKLKSTVSLLLTCF